MPNKDSLSKYTKVIPSDIEAALGWMLNCVDEGKTLLDIGCSTGYFGKYIKSERKCKVEGIEISKDALEARKVLDKVYSFDLEGEWPQAFNQNRYDYILIGDVLEHLKEPAEVLKKARDVLNKDGLIFVSIPNIAHLSVRLELIRGSFQYEDTGLLDNTHLQYFTLPTFEKMILGAGYEIVSVNYSLNDYPEQIIKKLLTKAGLQPNKKFWEIADSVEARAYQYKFILRVKSGKTSVKQLLPLPPKSDHFRDTFIKDLQSQIKAIDSHAKEQAKIIAAKDAEIRNLQKQSILKNSSIIKAIKPYIKKLGVRE